MSQGFEAWLNDGFRAADADRSKVEEFKKQARRHPVETASRVSEGIPILMKQLHDRAGALFGADIANPEGLEVPKPLQLNDEVRLLLMANTYRTLQEHQRKVVEYGADTSLSSQQRATKICEVGVEAMQALEAVLLNNLHEIGVHASSFGSEEAARVAKEAEAQALASRLATRISLERNKRLKWALDENRGREKPPKRERFESLLRELYISAPKVWAEHHRTDWQLRTTRSDVVRRLEKQSDGPSTQLTEENELADFANREELLRIAKSKGLPPREYELFALVVGNSRRFLRSDRTLKHREAAEELGVAVGTVKSMWSRIKRTLFS
jgi:hypothetical protein